MLKKPIETIIESVMVLLVIMKTVNGSCWSLLVIGLLLLVAC